MQIAYLQKISLQDFPDTISCIIFLGGCNFRCPGCYNSNILDLKKSLVNEKEIFDFLEKRRGKLEGVVITGGEPLINPDITQFLKKIRERGYKIKIDTNGSNPELLKSIIKKGLVDYISMDIKAGKDNYDKIAGVSVDTCKIEESMKILSDSNINFEFRTTFFPGISEIDIVEIASWIAQISKQAKFFLQPFIPVRDRLVDKKLEDLPQTKKETLEKAKQKAEKFLANCYIREQSFL